MAKELNITPAATPPESFGSRLAKTRTACGLSKKAAAEMLGIPYRTFQNYELGISNPPEWLINMICRELVRVSKEQ